MTCNAPILLFVYRRLSTLKQTIESLKLNNQAKESDLFIFSDGGVDFKSNIEVKLVRSYIKQISGFKSVTVFTSHSNLGLAKSIIKGVSRVLDKYDRVIVIEDDLILSENFLTFMNSCLETYKSYSEIIAISGYSFTYNNILNDFDNYFLSRFWPWGWATWKDRWSNIDWNVSSYSTFIKDKSEVSRFEKLGSDVNSMLAKQMNGKIDSWAIRFTFHIFCQNGLVVFPTISKVTNSGFDSFATHTKGLDNRYQTILDSGEIRNFKLNSHVLLSKEYQASFLKKFSIWPRLINKVREILFHFKF